MWIAGDRDDTLATLQRAGVDYVEARTFADVADQASFLTVSWTFGFMQSLGVAAARAGRSAAPPPTSTPAGGGGCSATRSPGAWA